MRRILPGLYTFTGLILGRVYLIKDPDGLTVIDTGLWFTPKQILRQIAGQGYKPEDIKRILVTHAHLDHIGGLHELQAKTAAQVYASEPERLVVEDGQPVQGPPPEDLSVLLRLVPRVDMKVESTPVARVVKDGDVLPEVMGGLHVVATPGHSPGHTAYWQPEKRVFFGGDVMSLGLNRLRLPARLFTANMAQNIRSIGRVTQLPVDILCLGHGFPIIKGTTAIIRAFAQQVGAI